MSELLATLRDVFPQHELTLHQKGNVTQLVLTKRNGTRRAFAFYHTTDLPQPTQAELVAYFSQRLREVGEDY